MKFTLFLLTIFYTISSYSQCFDCGHSIGGHVEDYVVDIDKVSDGIVLTINPDQGWGRSIYKYDFNCNLMWSNLFNPDGYGTADHMVFIDTTVDSNDNIYSMIGNSRAGITVDGFSIEMGNSLVKLNSNGAIEWVRKISDENYLKRKVHFWNGNIFVTGELDKGINNNIGLTIPSDSGSEYFVAKFDISGNLIKSELYGTKSYDSFFDSQIDNEGNIYFIGQTQSSSVGYPYSSGNPFFTKVDSNLNLVWTIDISGYLNFSFTPLTLYYNSSNDKLYIWSKYYNENGTSNGCNVGSAVIEVSKNTGEVENKIIIDNCGYEQSVGNGTGNVDQKSFMTHEGNNLYVLSSFRGELTIGDQTITTSQNLYDEYNSDLVLYKIDLSDFSAEIITRSEGENTYPTYYDLAGPIVAVDNSVYITSSFTSHSITINGNTIENNSGNNDRDILYYKHNLSQTNLNSLISFQNTCYSQNTEFLINGDFDAVAWNFDDPSSGLNNISSSNEPNHVFTNSGVYNVLATVTCGTDTEVKTIEVVINESPKVNQIEDIYGCEDTYGSQISNSFNTSAIEKDLVGNQSNLSIKYFDGNGEELPSPLSNPMTNSILGKETIIARVAYVNNKSCYTETSFDLIIKQMPNISSVKDLYICDNDTDGFSLFDLSETKQDILSNNTDINVIFFHENGQQIYSSELSAVSNKIKNQENITARVTNTITKCSNETTFTIAVVPIPIAYALSDLTGCDDNGDGISEYFDTSKIEEIVMDNQVGLEVSYFNELGVQLSSPLPNPYSNTTPDKETITVRVTNPESNCYSETVLKLKTSSQPQIDQPATLYACDNGNGIGSFDTSTIEEQLIGDQSGLLIYYYDENGNSLPSPLPSVYLNTIPWKQTMWVKVENELNKLCYSETSFEMIVNELPKINLENNYFLCDLEPSLNLASNSNFDTWKWTYEDGSVISNTFDANLIEAGSYTLQVSTLKNGISCENSYSFNLVRSILPVISEIEIQDISDNNTIQIITSGTGDFEYSIDGINYQDDSVFYNLSGGVYNVQVRDKNGCGLDSKEVVVVGYPRIFTPNNDGYNDSWQIDGVEKFQDSRILIYDRYGKLLKELTSNSVGWDGTFNGNPMPSNDYWFTVFLSDGRTFKGHFSLIR